MPGLLSIISKVLKDLGLEVGKATVAGDDSRFCDKFFVQRSDGGKVTDQDQIKDVTTALELLLKAKAKASTISRPRFESTQGGDTGRMRTMMGEICVSSVSDAWIICTL